jgi:hydrogenase/urease accessory protein HupE
MPQRQQRARRQPGPLVLLALLLATARLLAHDPGLSSLEVNITRLTTSAVLSMSAADLAVLVSESGIDAERALDDLARSAVQISVDGLLLGLTATAVELDDRGANVRLSFARGAAGEARVTVSSSVPVRLARGHRELVVVAVDGQSASERILDSDNQSLSVDVAALPSTAGKASSFMTLGIRHILSGYDHLVFLAGLILAACTVRELLVALTAFTAAHSLSLALVVLGGVHAPPAIVEPLIAASIAWVGVENLIRDRRGSRWWVVFGFGLVHGFGFAGALLDLGFGSSAAGVALALLSFNIGVEFGQLAAAAVMLPLVWVMRSRPAWQARLVPVCSMLIAIAGGYWLVDRLW